MTVAELIAYSLAKPGAEETFPWGPTEMIVMFRGKAFACIPLDGSALGVRCGVPETEIPAWRQRHPKVMTPDSFLISTGWGRFTLPGIPDGELRDLVDRSYTDVVTQFRRRT